MKGLLRFTAAAVIVALLLLAPSMDAAPIEEASIHGISHKENNKFFQLAVEEHSRMAMPVIEWFIYATENSTLIHRANGELLIEENITAGLHRYELTYATGEQVMTWQLNDELWTFSLRITTSSQEIIEDDNQEWVQMTMESLSQTKLNIAIGCIILALVPSVFMIPFWRRRKQETIDDIL